MAVDLDIWVKSGEELDAILKMAETLGYSTIGIRPMASKIQIPDSPVSIYERFDSKTKKLTSLKSQVSKARAKYVIVALPLLGVDTANWAAEESRVDILIADHTGQNTLRMTTARMCAQHGTALEIQIAPLLETNGLNRSRIFKALRDTTTTAMKAGMQIVLTSGAALPIHMRSPMALIHIGMALGLDRKSAKDAISDTPESLIQQNLKKQNGQLLSPGIEIIQYGDEHEAE